LVAMRIGFLKKESLHGVKRQKRLRPLILNHAAVAVCQIDRETRWFEEDLALFGSMRQATESRYAMEQELNLVIARTPNPVHRPHAKKVSPIEAQVAREAYHRRKYIDKQEKLTPLARTIIGEWPVAKGEPAAEFEFLLFSALSSAVLRSRPTSQPRATSASHLGNPAAVVCSRSCHCGVLHRRGNGLATATGLPLRQGTAKDRPNSARLSVRSLPKGWSIRSSC
jgi:hypothetical protein